MLWLAQHEPAQVFRPDVMIRLKPIGSLNVLNSPKLQLKYMKQKTGLEENGECGVHQHKVNVERDTTYLSEGPLSCKTNFLGLLSVF